MSLHLHMFLFFSGSFFFFYFCPIPNCLGFILFYFIISPLITVCFLRRDRKSVEVERNWEELGKGNHNQNILCRKISLFNKSKIRKSSIRS